MVDESTYRTAPIDGDLDALARRHGLDVRIVDEHDEARSRGWFEATARGFLNSERTAQQHAGSAERARDRRRVGVFDASTPLADIPVATISSWRTLLTLPGGALPSCAISDVTVAPTHRRRGLLRGVLTGELRTAAANGFALASLTVSESSIYGRFGFAPAVFSASAVIDTRRAGWIGPEPAGRIDFLSGVDAAQVVGALHDRVRATMPGEVDHRDPAWQYVLGLAPDADKPEALRILQYRSEEGGVDGLAVYRVTENPDDFAKSTVTIVRLLAATDDAYAALWRFVLSLDLIATIHVSELAVDEPLWWMIADRRAATVTVRDHEYLRILDVPAALGARRYAAQGAVVLEVEDALGIAAGRFLLEVDADGAPEVRAITETPAHAPVLELGVTELSAVLLGGVSPVTLARAGRARGAGVEPAARLFATATAPRLSFWY